MKTTTALICSIAVSLVFVSCSPTQVGVGSQKPPASATPTGSIESNATLTVVNDLSSNQAVFVSETGARIAVQTVAGTDGPAVRCVYSSGFASAQQASGSDSLPVKGVVVGQRDDGNPGIWEVDTDNSIQLVQNEQAGTKGLLAPQQAQFPNGMHPRFGWVYYPTAVSPDCRVIVGYAENPNGYKPLSIPKGTTIGVYWQVDRASFGKHVRVSAPFVIGTWQAENKPRGFHPRFATPFPSFLTQLKIFFLNELQSYLITATAVDKPNNNYVVTGTDEDGEAATATISPNGQIVITPVQSTTTSYTEIVIDTYYPLSTGTFMSSPFQNMELLNASGAVLASDNSGSNPDGNELYFAYIDYKPAQPLTSGTVLYIRISGNPATATGAYAIMAQTSPPTLTGGLAPASYYTFFGTALSTDPYAAGNTPNFPPSDPAVITLGVAGALNRYLSASAVEWVQITLP